MKFGGTSVATAQAIRRMISIVRGRLDLRPVIVVSALSKVTDLLYKISDSAASSDFATARAQIAQLRERHLGLARELLTPEATTETNPEAKPPTATVPNAQTNPEALKKAQTAVTTICDRLESFVEAVCSLGELTDRSKARIISKGEWLSSTIIHHALNAAGITTGFIDARKIIITTGSYLKGEPRNDEICRLAPPAFDEALAGVDTVITQGFIASDGNGRTTVLGRGGSDYSASLLGMALNAERIEIWTDVDGVRTADPRVVPDTRSISRISFEEAAEMAHFGAKVLHPMTIEPAVAKNIPVHVLNSMNPAGEGTAILQGDQIADGVKSVSYKENILLLNIFSTKMINVSGFLQKVFAVFSDHGVSVDLISTSEANISLTMDSTQDITGVIDDLSRFSEVTADYDKAQVSIIGKNIVNLRGLLRDAMASLSGCNVYMISQGASFVNISFVVDKARLGDVVREIHDYLFNRPEAQAEAANGN